jgi:hypothetical protein
MANYKNREVEQRLQTYLSIYLKNSGDASIPEQIKILHKKIRNKWIQLIINVAIILIFGYTYLNGFAELSELFMYIIVGIFVINMGLIFYQKNQMNELIDYLNWKREESV